MLNFYLHLNKVIQVCLAEDALRMPCGSLAEAREAAAVVGSNQYDIINMACVTWHILGHP